MGKGFAIATDLGITFEQTWGGRILTLLQLVFSNQFRYSKALTLQVFISEIAGANIFAQRIFRRSSTVLLLENSELYISARYLPLLIWRGRKHLTYADEVMEECIAGDDVIFVKGTKNISVVCSACILTSKF